MPRLMGVTAAAAVLGMSMLVAPADAQRRPDTRAMTCGEAQNLVQQSGAIVLTTGRFTYDRFVADTRFRPSGQVAETAWVETRDAAECPIGNTCVMAPEPDDLWWMRP